MQETGEMTSVLNIADFQCIFKGIQVVWDIWQNDTTAPMPLSLCKEWAMKLRITNDSFLQKQRIWSAAEV